MDGVESVGENVGDPMIVGEVDDRGVEREGAGTGDIDEDGDIDGDVDEDGNEVVEGEEDGESEAVGARSLMTELYTVEDRGV